MPASDPVLEQPAVRRAIATAFGPAPVDALEPISGGLSGSGVWRLRIAGGTFLLKIEPPRDGLMDPPRVYACMAIAAEAGVAPGVRFADPEAGVAIIDHVEVRPLLDHPGGRTGLLAGLGALLRRLHAAPVFPPLVDFPAGVDGLFEQLRALGVVEPAWLDGRLRRWSAVKAASRWGCDGLTASHNDLNPLNILYDGSRLWLVDWQAAFRNDPWVDLAIVANFLTLGPEDEDALLGAYLDGPVTEAARERLRLMQPVCRAYYGVMLMASAAAAGWRPAAGAVWAGLDEIQADMRQGRLSVGEPEVRFAYGRALLEAMG